MGYLVAIELNKERNQGCRGKKCRSVSVVIIEHRRVNVIFEENKQIQIEACQGHI